MAVSRALPSAAAVGRAIDWIFAPVGPYSSRNTGAAAFVRAAPEPTRYTTTLPPVNRAAWAWEVVTRGTAIAAMTATVTVPPRTRRRVRMSTSLNYSGAETPKMVE